MIHGERVSRHSERKAGPRAPRLEMRKQTGDTSPGLRYHPAAMGTPQDPAQRRRDRKRRAKKNLEWEEKRASENAEAAKPKAPPKTAT